MRKPLVAILGCGPSGLLAAHACEMRGVPFVIFSKKAKSVLGGAQYSHIAIPGIHDESEPEAMLRYRVAGDPEEYRRKVYGEEEVEFVSIENVKDGLEVPAWNLRRLYDTLWGSYEEKIIDVSLDPNDVSKIPGGFSVTFCSMPADKTCVARLDPSIQHWFRSTPIRLVNEALDPSLPDNTISYNGEKSPSWYRMSKIFGVGSTEWSARGPVPPIDDVRTISKPTSTNCECHLHRGVVRIGRFGTWSKGQLTFHAYNRVVDVLAEMGVE